MGSGSSNRSHDQRLVKAATTAAVAVAAQSGLERKRLRPQNVVVPKLKKIKNKNKEKENQRKERNEGDNNKNADERTTIWTM